MKTRYGMGVGLTGLLLATIAFAGASVASQPTNDVIVAASSAENRAIEEIVVTARRPGAEKDGVSIAMQEPLELLRDTPIAAPELDVALTIKPEIRLTL